TRSCREARRPRSSRRGCGTPSWGVPWGPLSGVEAGQGGGQLLVGHPAGPVVELLTVAALGLVAPNGAQQRLGDVIDRSGILDPVDERRIGTERASHPDVDGFDDALRHVGDIAPEADVGDLWL